jgi:hypothetical protein
VKGGVSPPRKARRRRRGDAHIVGYYVLVYADTTNRAGGGLGHQGGAERLNLDFLSDQSLDAGTVQMLPRWAADLFSPLARPQLATHLIVGELYEVERGRI